MISCPVESCPKELQLSNFLTPTLATMKSTNCNEFQLLTFRCLPELCLSIRALILVWMKFHGKLVKSLLNLTFGGIFRYTQNIIIVLFGQYQFCYHQDAHSDH